MLVPVLLLQAFLWPLLALCHDDVTERLMVQPLKNGDWLLGIKVTIVCHDHNPFHDEASYPGILNDLMPPDITALYLKSKADYFEGTIGYGDWNRHLWGNSLLPIIPHGLTLSAKWLHGDYKHRLHDYDTICHGLWGITGAMFTNLTSEEGYVFDTQKLLALEDPTSTKDDSEILVASCHDQALCVENLYKWRHLMPCAAKRGLVSLLADERLFSQAPHRGIAFLVTGNRKQLSFESHVQFVVPHDKLKSIWDAFPDGAVPPKCPNVQVSSIDFLLPPHADIPHPELAVDEGILRLPFEKAHILDEVFEAVEHVAPADADLLFEVTELDSSYLDVHRRMQSSLSVRLENNNPEKHKFVRYHQPLPYWMVPLMHTLEIIVTNQEGEVTYSCKADDCFFRNDQQDRIAEYFKMGDDLTKGWANYDPFKVQYVHYMQPMIVQQNPIPSHYSASAEEIIDHGQPLMIYDKQKRWNVVAFSIKLPPKSRLVCRVDLRKNRIFYDDLHFSIHRGQAVPSGLIIDMEKTSIGRVCIKGRTQGETRHAQVYFPGAMFSHIVFPDTTMTFNVMAGSGIIVGLLFGICFNTIGKRWGDKVQPIADK